MLINNSLIVGAETEDAFAQGSSNDPTITSNAIAFVNQRFEEEKRALFNEKLSDANKKLGIDNKLAGVVTAKYGSDGDVLPFTASKKYAKMLKNTKYNDIAELHSKDYWSKQLDEIEQIAHDKVENEIREAKKTLTEKKDESSSSGIILR